MWTLACRSRRSPLRRRGRHSACPLTADRAAHRPRQRSTRPAILSAAAASPRLGVTFLRRSGATSGNATEGAAVIVIRSPGVAAPRPICCRSTTCCGRPGGWPGAVQPPVSVRSTSQDAPRPRPRTGCTAGAADVAPPPRCCRAARLRWPTARRWPGGDTLRIVGSRSCILAAASSGLGRSLSPRSRKALSWCAVNELQQVATLRLRVRIHPPVRGRQWIAWGGCGKPSS